MKILAGRWALAIGSSGSAQQYDPAFIEPAAVGIRWNIEYFGLQRMEITVNTNGTTDSYSRYRNHLGQRIAVYGGGCYRPISAIVTAVERLNANQVRYIGEGPASTYLSSTLHDAILLDTEVIGGATGALADILADMNDRIDNTDFSNIATNNTTLGGYQYREPQGSYTVDALQELREKTDSSGNTFDFWLLDEPFNGTDLQRWVPYYELRTTKAVDWVVSVNDLTDIQTTRSIKNVKTDVNIYWGTILGTHSGATKGTTVTGTHDGAPNSQNLIDSTANFIRDGVRKGDVITNTTDVISAEVTLVTQTQVNMKDEISGGVDMDWDVSDGYSIKTYTSTGNHTGASNVNYLEDSGAAFQAAATRVLWNDLVINFTDGSSVVAQEATSGTRVSFNGNLTGGTDDDFDSGVPGDYYIIAHQKVLVDPDTDFLEVGVKPGDRVTNITDGSRGSVATVWHNTLILSDLTGGTANVFDDGDSYSVEMRDAKEASLSVTDPEYWQVEWAEQRPGMTETQANQRALQLVNAAAEQVQSFTITAPYILGIEQAEYPLWAMIERGGGYIRIRDLYPDLNLFDVSRDEISTFFITALDYDYTTNTMRVNVDTFDRRLDMRLKRAEILGSEMINRGTR